MDSVNDGNAIRLLVGPHCTANVDICLPTFCLHK